MVDLPPAAVAPVTVVPNAPGTSWVPAEWAGSPTITASSTAYTFGAGGGGAAWSTWVADADAAQRQYVWNNWNEQIELTREQRESLERWQREENERLAQRQAQWEEQRQRALGAKERATALLHSLLSPTQRRTLERHGHFYVTGNRGRRYCIRGRGQAGNVDWMEAPKKVGGSLCIHPSGVCDEDAWITQMLAIMHDEDHFLRTANLTGGKWPPDSPRAPAAAPFGGGGIVVGGNVVGNIFV